MRISTIKVMICTTFVSLFLVLYFCTPLWLAMIVYVLFAWVIIPPFLWTGAFNTNGATKAFFVSAIVAGIPHAITQVYFFSFIGGFTPLLSNDNSHYEEILGRLLYLAGFLPGLFGGFMGVFHYHFFGFANSNSKDKSIEKKKVSEIDPLAD